MSKCPAFNICHIIRRYFIEYSLFLFLDFYINGDFLYSMALVGHSLIVPNRGRCVRRYKRIFVS